MCGIQVLVQQSDGSDTSGDSCCTEIWDRLTAINRNRGPDAHNEHVVSISPLACLGSESSAQIKRTTIRFGAHVLHLRGPETQSQPIVSKDTGDVLCWNGEVFGGLDVGARNDGIVLSETIQEMKRQDPKDYVLRVFGRIEGPYAFAYFDHDQQKLWFARDYLGRRSLVTKWVPNTNSLLISSVADGTETDNEHAKWTELPAQSIYCLDLAGSCSLASLAVSESAAPFAQYSWKYESDIERPMDASKDNPSAASKLVLPFGQVTPELVDNPPPPPSTNASVVGLDGFPELALWQPYIDGLERVLTESIRTRIESVPLTHGADTDPKAPRVGILFSGGVDCITIAALLTKILPQGEAIELFNVAFENPRQTRTAGTSNAVYDVPDRRTGRQGWLELCGLDPMREWRFVEIDVPYTQVLEHRAHIRNLLTPSDTVMDMSIGMALWFASKGAGLLVVRKSDTDNTVVSRHPYEGAARVLLLGMGADEQLGGYSRHRGAWDRGGWTELGTEIRLDVQRIATRNLGRDDRIVSDNGKESRYPFLAAEVVGFLSRTPLDRKMNMHYPRGMGEKLLLRLLAFQLGLTAACTLAKRAIQFGARTAKMESGQTKGQNTL